VVLWRVSNGVRRAGATVTKRFDWIAEVEREDGWIVLFRDAEVILGVQEDHVISSYSEVLMQVFDIVILGAGAGAKMIWGSVPGRSVAVVEQGLVGGECPFFACVPSKTMLRTARVWQLAADPPHSALFTGRVAARDAFQQAVQRRDEVVHNRDDSANAAALEKAGAVLVRGTGRIARPGVIDVDGIELGYRELVLNPGSAPVRPAIAGLDSVPVWTSDTAMSSSEQPERMLVVGGGPVGCELAFLYATFGTAVVLVEPVERLVPREEPEASAALNDLLVQSGVTIRLGSEVTRLEPHDGGARAFLHDGQTDDVDRVLVAAGRRPRSSTLNLEKLGVELDETGVVAVDAHCRVRGAEHVWAVGDVTGVAPFTHTAHYQGRVVAANLRGEAIRANYQAVPRAVYTNPVLASVGHTRASANAAGIEPIVVHAPMSQAVRAATEGDSAGWLTVLADRSRGVVIGATAFGGYAEEWLSEVSLAIRAEIPLWVAADVVHPFPTYSEILEVPWWQLASQLRPPHPSIDYASHTFEPS
jgi:pyruvate/2-oxoglutarate dehydrogenase complex dihydrolipoamide dehydrogenase (E3) component